ncbi:MAG: hypothetical protein H7Y33_16295 [Cytophagales bacterium]|nr:hypothetical protein [Rhizobacter sp.]
MKRLRWEAMHWLRGIGLPGWVALALALAGALSWWGGVVPLLDQAKRYDTDSAVLQRRLNERSPDATAAVRTPQQQLAEFERRFSGEKSIATSLASLHAAARRQGVQLDQAEFKLSSDAREPLARYSIVLPVKADYRALRRFTRDAVRELPGLAMEEVNLRRSDPKAPVLDAQLRFVLFVTKAS